MRVDIVGGRRIKQEYKCIRAVKHEGNHINRGPQKPENQKRATTHEDTHTKITKK